MERQRKGQQDRTHRLLANLSWKWHPIILSVSHLLEMKHWVQLHIQGEEIIEVCKYQDAEITGGHLEAAYNICTSWNIHYKWVKTVENKIRKHRPSLKQSEWMFSEDTGGKDKYSEGMTCKTIANMSKSK